MKTLSQQHNDTNEAFQNMLLREIKAGLKQKLQQEADNIIEQVMDDALRVVRYESTQFYKAHLAESVVEVHLFKNKEPLK